MHNLSGSRRSRAFTLVEVVVATAIIGLVFTTLMEAFATGLKMHEQSEQMTVAAALAEEIHEMTLTLPLRDPAHPTLWGLQTGEPGPPFGGVDDFDGQSFSPPVFADGTRITALADYSQNITVACVSNTNYSQTLTDGASNVFRVTVSVTRHGTEVSCVSWLIVGSP